MSTLTMKFGGATVGTTAALTQVLSIVLHEHNHWDRLLLVVSALDGVTDALIEAAHLARLDNRRGYRRIVATLRTRHMALVQNLPLGENERINLLTSIDRRLFDLLETCQTLPSSPPDTIDSVASVGERLSARIVAALIRQNNIPSVALDATDLIVTDAVYTHATPNLTLTRERIGITLLPMLERQIIPVVTGYIGATVEGKTTTLGRGGSDYTASILGVGIAADEIWVWSDVDGMMSADPHILSEARTIPLLSHDEVAELAYFGARILHERMIEPIRDEKVSLRVKNVYKPQSAGSLIQHKSDQPEPGIKAVTSIQGLGLSAARSGPLATITGLVDETLFTTIGARAEVMISSQTSSQSFLCFVIPTSAGPDAAYITATALEHRLLDEADAFDWSVRPVSIITAIGFGIDRSPTLIAQLLHALDPIAILALAQGPSHCSISFVVEPKETLAALTCVHKLIVNSD